MLRKGAPIQVRDRVVVAGGPKGRHRAWPALEMAANGDLLVAYAESDDHHRNERRRADAGQIDRRRQNVAFQKGGGRGAGLGRLHQPRDDPIERRQTAASRGTGRRDPASNGFYARGSFTQSSDDGRFWERAGPELDYPFVCRFGHAFSYGRVAELSDGRLMVPFYGVPKDVGDRHCRVLAVAFSGDGGFSWPDYAIIHEDRSAVVGPSEADLLQLDDGRFLIVVRANVPGLLYRSYSTDEGRTWSGIQPTDMPGNCPALIALASGEILCVYRDVTLGQPGMSCAASRDLGESWTPLGHLYRGKNRDCAYPSMVNVGEGEILCVYYTARDAETGGCEIHGLFLQDRTSAKS